jgi:hypothetical protein
MLEMDEGAKRWLYKICHKQFWRVSGWYEFDDLVQDGFVTFYRVRGQYPKIDKPQHLMTIFKMAFLQHIHVIANRRTKHGVESCFTDLFNSDLPDQETQALERLLPADQPLAEAFTAIAQAPEPVRQLLEKVAVDPALLQAPYRRRRDGTRQTLNERLCHLVDVKPALPQNGLWFWLEPGVDLVSMIRQILDPGAPDATSAR